MNHQFILGGNQEALFAVIPYCEYKQVFAPKEHVVQESEKPQHIPLSIRLPNGGPSAAIDLPRFVDYWCRKGILSMPINSVPSPSKTLRAASASLLRPWFACALCRSPIATPCR